MPKGIPRPKPRKGATSAASELTTVKLTQEMKDQAKEIVAELSAHGWSSYGISRTDPPSLVAVIEEGIRALREKSPKRRKEGA